MYFVVFLITFLYIEIFINYAEISKYKINRIIRKSIIMQGRQNE
jgi:hypothetical protein